MENNDGDSILAELEKTAREGIAKGQIAAFGEIGLDYDRTDFCPIPVQTK